MAIQLWFREATETDQVVATLLLSYAVHALLFALAAAVMLRRRELSYGARSFVCKVALFAPLATTLAACAVMHVVRLRGTPSQLPSSDLLAAPVGLNPPAWIVSCFVAAFMLGCARFCGKAAYLALRLRRRESLNNVAVRARLECLRADTELAPIRLSEDDGVTGPCVLGRREICLPRGLAGRLPDHELGAVLAHELSHLERHDGLFFPLTSLLTNSLWFVPSNHWLAAQFRANAEFSCDDRALELIRDPQALAGALVRVAALAQSASTHALPAMARAESPVAVRVRRLVDLRSSPTADLRVAKRPLLALTPLLALVGLVIQASAQPPGAGLRLATVPVEESYRQLELLAEEHRSISVQLQAAEAASHALPRDVQASVRVLELSQQLSHIRGNALFIEGRLLEAAK